MTDPIQARHSPTERMVAVRIDHDERPWLIVREDLGFLCLVPDEDVADWTPMSLEAP